MTYANNTIEQVSTFLKIKRKFGKILAKSFPYNRVRIFGLKLCNFTIGKQVYIGTDLIVASIISENACNLIIKDRVAIGPRVTLILSSDANWSNLMNQIEPIKGTIILEDDCWIGAGVIILPNIIVGNGSIVGAGSVVTKNVPPNSIVAGVPAKIIRTI
ncbi:MAG: DapH/DapD/GlmU-related protein [Bacteroidales bacterium]